MTNVNIVDRAIRKCASSLWPEKKFVDIEIIEELGVIRVDIYFDDKSWPWLSVPYKEIIFSHEFAKAFFGELLINIDFKQIIIENGPEKFVNIVSQEKAWRFHISEMVKCEEPLKYLEKFLDE